MAPPFKAPGTRARRNKSSTNAMLRKPDEEEVIVPGLPRKPEGWHGLTKRWWVDLWHSPMAPEYDESDLHGLWLIAQLMDDFWKTGNTKVRREMAAEIRLQGVRFGISPIDRRRLQWEIERSEEAVDKGARRRREAAQRAQEPRSLPSEGKDPRELLRIV